MTIIVGDRNTNNYIYIFGSGTSTSVTELIDYATDYSNSLTFEERTILGTRGYPQDPYQTLPEPTVVDSDEFSEVILFPSKGIVIAPDHKFIVDKNCTIYFNTNINFGLFTEDAGAGNLPSIGPVINPISHSLVFTQGKRFSLFTCLGEIQIGADRDTSAFSSAGEYNDILPGHRKPKLRLIRGNSSRTNHNDIDNSGILNMENPYTVVDSMGFVYNNKPAVVDFTGCEINSSRVIGTFGDMITPGSGANNRRKLVDKNIIFNDAIVRMNLNIGNRAKIDSAEYTVRDRTRSELQVRHGRWSLDNYTQHGGCMNFSISPISAKNVTLFDTVIETQCLHNSNIVLEDLRINTSNSHIKFQQNTHITFGTNTSSLILKNFDHNQVADIIVRGALGLMTFSSGVNRFGYADSINRPDVSDFVRVGDRLLINNLNSGEGVDASGNILEYPVIGIRPVSSLGVVLNVIEITIPAGSSLGGAGGNLFAGDINVIQTGGVDKIIQFEGGIGEDTTVERELQTTDLGKVFYTNGSGSSGVISKSSDSPAGSPDFTTLDLTDGANTIIEMFGKDHGMLMYATGAPDADTLSINRFSVIGLTDGQQNIGSSSVGVDAVLSNFGTTARRSAIVENGVTLGTEQGDVFDNGYHRGTIAFNKELRYNVYSIDEEGRTNQLTTDVEISLVDTLDTSTAGGSSVTDNRPVKDQEDKAYTGNTVVHHWSNQKKYIQKLESDNTFSVTLYPTELDYSSVDTDDNNDRPQVNSNNKTPLVTVGGVFTHIISKSSSNKLNTIAGVSDPDRMTGGIHIPPVLNSRLPIIGSIRKYGYKEKQIIIDEHTLINSGGNRIIERIFLEEDGVIDSNSVIPTAVAATNLYDIYSNIKVRELELFRNETSNMVNVSNTVFVDADSKELVFPVNSVIIFQDNVFPAGDDFGKLVKIEEISGHLQYTLIVGPTFNVPNLVDSDVSNPGRVKSIKLPGTSSMYDSSNGYVLDNSIQIVEEVTDRTFTQVHPSLSLTEYNIAVGSDGEMFNARVIQTRSGVIIRDNYNSETLSITLSPILSNDRIEIYAWRKNHYPIYNEFTVGLPSGDDPDTSRINLNFSENPILNSSTINDNLVKIGFPSSFSTLGMLEPVDAKNNITDDERLINGRNNLTRFQFPFLRPAQTESGPYLYTRLEGDLNVGVTTSDFQDFDRVTFPNSSDPDRIYFLNKVTDADPIGTLFEVYTSRAMDVKIDVTDVAPTGAEPNQILRFASPETFGVDFRQTENFQNLTNIGDAMDYVIGSERYINAIKTISEAEFAADSSKTYSSYIRSNLNLLEIVQSGSGVGIRIDSKLDTTVGPNFKLRNTYIRNSTVVLPVFIGHSPNFSLTEEISAIDSIIILREETTGVDINLLADIVTRKVNDVSSTQTTNIDDNTRTLLGMTPGQNVRTDLLGMTPGQNVRTDLLGVNNGETVKVVVSDNKESLATTIEDITPLIGQ